MSNSKQIISDKGGNFLIVPNNNLNTVGDFDPGFYAVHMDNSLFGNTTSIVLSKKTYPKDLINFSDGIMNEIVSDCESFFSEEIKDKYEDISMSHQMGAILYGKPGTGKTSTCMLLAKNLANKYDCITMDFTNVGDDIAFHVLKEVRNLTDKPIMAYFDEFEKRGVKPSSTLLSILDGSMNIDDLLCMACTNHIEEIADKIKFRKSRMKHSYKVESLPMQVYKEYMAEKLSNMEDNEIERLAFFCEDKGLIIDDLKHVIIDVYINGVDMQEAIEEAAAFREKTDSDVDEQEMRRRNRGDSSGF